MPGESRSYFEIYEAEMISLKRYLDSKAPLLEERGDAEPQDSFAVAMDAYGSVLQAMGGCSLDACPGLGDGFQQAMAERAAELVPSIGAETLAKHGKQSCEQVRGWGRDASRHYQAAAREVKEMLLAMTQAAESVSSRDKHYADQMNDVTQRLRSVATLDDLATIRASIDRSAAELKTSIERMTEEGKQALDHLRKQVEEYRTKLDEAERASSRDPLTGASSRLYTEGQIEQRIESGSAFCVAVVDIDSFKRVNDAHGHVVGDELLRQFAGELRSACRSTDIIGRWGGDEFLLLFDATLEEAEAQADRLRKWVCGNYTLTGKQGVFKLPVNASLGLAAHVAGETMTDLLARADAAMYAQKAAGRGKAA